MPTDPATTPMGDSAQLERLKHLLKAIRPGKLENLAAALIGRLLGVSVAVAKSGFQHGGDAGTVGRQGRRLRVETKRYANSTSLGERELLGEFDQALERDPALEAWILVATRNVPEQLEQSLLKRGEASGVPVVIVDWKDDGFPSLGALCASAPEVLDELVSKEAGDLARALGPSAKDAIARLKRDLEVWSLGFEALRAATHERLTTLWTSPRASRAAFGQDAAGGNQPHRIRRDSVHAALDRWAIGHATEDAPAAVIGLDGVGKTWATLDWIVDRRDDLPLVLIIPSSTVAGIGSVSVATIKRLLAGRLYEIADVRDADHWLRRLDRLLQRPIKEGPVIMLFLDGLNQEPSAPWLAILSTLQEEKFSGRVHVVASTRNHYFIQKLDRLKGLVVRPVMVEVDMYHDEPCGELDRMLAFEGLSQADLHPDLLPFARIPRLFSLIVRFRDRLVEAEQVTLHRLLWEYGRDTLGVRVGRSFSEDDWHAWLREIAERYRDGARDYTLRTLGEMAARPDLTQNEVFARLSDIIDARFATTGSGGVVQLSPTVVAHALGAALLAHLDARQAPSLDAAEEELSQWLDPIAGLDERAEILRAAVSIMVERGDPPPQPVAAALVAAWLQTQNIPDAHRSEVARLAAEIIEPLLETIERSSDRAQASARNRAVNALRAIPRDNAETRSAIVAHARRWLSLVSRDVDPPERQHAEAERARSQRLVSRVGVDRSGPLTVLGVPLEFVDRAYDTAAVTISSLLEGFPLAGAVQLFEFAALTVAVGGRYELWEGLKWLCLFNDVDSAETAQALRELSAQVARRTPERAVGA